MAEHGITITKGRSVGMSELAGDELLAWMKRMRLCESILFMKPRQLGMSSHADWKMSVIRSVIMSNIELIERDVFARGGRYQVKPDLPIKQTVKPLPLMKLRSQGWSTEAFANIERSWRFNMRKQFVFPFNPFFINQY